MGASPIPKIFIEKRAGKTITVVSGLVTYGSHRLNDMAKEIKSALGTGGTVKDGRIEVQGDKVSWLKEWMTSKNRETSHD